MEYVLVSLVHGLDGGLLAYPTGKGSGAVTSFAQADGYFAVPALTESVAAGSDVVVQLIGAAHEPADLVIIGSHCVGLDLLVGRLAQQGVSVKVLNVGSSGGLAAARRGECDIAPIHLMDPATGVYNTPYLVDGLALTKGYGRMQGVVFRLGDHRFDRAANACLPASPEQILNAALNDPACVMANRNAGSGTRVVIDRLLRDRRPPGFTAQAKSHNGVAASVAQGRADWGVAIATVAARYGLGFLPLLAERYDFVIPAERLDRPAVQKFLTVLADPQVRAELDATGFKSDCAFT